MLFCRLNLLFLGVISVIVYNLMEQTLREINITLQVNYINIKQNGKKSYVFQTVESKKHKVIYHSAAYSLWFFLLSKDHWNVRHILATEMEKTWKLLLLSSMLGE
jgi:hypothetical protein